MARPRGGLLYLGIKGHVLAVDRDTGEERWRTKLQGVTMRAHEFVHLHRDGDALFAAYSGEVFCLDPRSGTVRWHNKLSRLGTGVVGMATDAPGAGNGPATLYAETQRRDAAAAAAAAT